MNGKILVKVPEGFVFGWRDVADLGVEPAVVVPVDPFDDREFEVAAGSPGPVEGDEFGLNVPFNASAIALS